MARKTGANSHAKGEGTVFQGKDGKWYAQITIGFKDDGNPKRKTRTARNKTEAIRLLSELKLQCQLGRITVKGDIMFRHYAERWFSFKETLKGKTLIDYEAILKNHIIPFFGTCRMSDITLGDVDSFLREKIKKDYAPSSIVKMRAVLNNIFERAVAEEIIAKNPVTHSIPIRLRKTERIVISRDDLSVIMNKALDISRSAREHGRYCGQSYAMYPILMTALHTGMRIGEILALCWDNVDLRNRRIMVEKSLSQKRSADGRIELSIGTTKTSASIRTVEISDTLCKIFTEMQTHARESKIVFHTKNGTHIAPNNWSRTWRSMLKELGMSGKYHPHEFRHTHVTTLLAEGFSPASVAKRVGHANAHTTLTVYAHAIDGDGRRMADIFDKKC